ncbi:hypothetical protein [Pseudoruminococcus massiliensis]|uniref:hypothetical protein n=1 Tax=Pseudoruminococcus massiliensis TaxID=2086583 RepID=UPI003AB79948
MTIYADEDFYKNNYLCGKKGVIDTAFSFYARSATQKIKLYTCDNIDESDIPECVKMCCCELAEKLYSYEQQITTVYHLKVLVAGQSHTKALRINKGT